MKKTVRKLDPKPFTQIAFVVKDVAKTSKAYAELFGLPVPKWQLTDGLDKAHTQYKGKQSKAKAKISFFLIGDIMMELIQPVGGPSTWKDHLETKGEGLHHIAFMVKDMDAHIKYLESKKVPLIQKGDFTGGKYAYLDGMKNLKVVLELLETF
jgi:methylmalonyl-CoA/ethylmalonyl-CoA epimerase